MINKFKSISRRTLAFLLTILMLLSSGIVGTLAANVDFVQTAANKELVETGADTYYLAGGMNDWSTSSLPMEEGVDTNGNTIYYSTASYSTQYQFKVVKNGTDWLGYKKASSDYYDTSITIYNYDNGGNCWPAPNYTYYVVYIPSDDKITCVTEVPLLVTHTVSITNTWSGTTDKPSLKVNGSSTSETVTSGTANTYSVANGGSFSFTCNSPTYYYVSSLKINDTEYVTDSTYFPTYWYKVEYDEVINGNVEIEIVHSPNPNVTTESYSNGTITLSASGAKYTYKNPITGTATANDDYYVSRIYAVKASDNTTVVAEKTNDDVDVKTLSVTVDQVTEDIVFKAVFTAKTTYTVTFKDYDGEVLKTETVVSGKSATAPADPTRTGYTFAGWDKDYTNITENTIVTATYDPISYDLDISTSSGGQINGGADTVEYGENITFTAVPNAGYKFKSWSINGGATLVEGSENTDEITITPNGTGKIYVSATFEPINYTVTFLDENGNQVDSQEVPYGTLISDITVKAPDKASTPEHNYAFAGWSQSQGGPAIATDFTVPVDGVTLYATYTETVRSYNVTVSGENGTAYATYENTNGETVTINGTASVAYGTELTLVADNPNIFYTTGSWDFENDGTYTVTGDATLTYTYASKDIKTITITEDGGNGTITYDAGTYDFAKNPDGTYTAEKGAVVTFNFTAPNGCCIRSLNDSTNTGYNVLTTSLVIDVNSGDKEITIVYDQIPSYTVTASANIAAAGTVTGGTTVSYGESVTLTATENTGYTFTGWNITPADGYRTESALTSKNITIIPTAGLSAIATYKANTGTVNFSAGVGGEVTNSGENTVEYPNNITSTASSTTDGYLFANWTVTSTNGTKVTDYNYTTNGSTITVEIFTDGVEVNAVANFSTGYKIDGYYLSESNFSDITIKEYNDVNTNKIVYSDGPLSTEDFEGTIWNDAGELSFTAGYTNSVTAQFSGDGLASGTGTLVMLKNTLDWDQAYLYCDDASLYCPDRTGNNNDNNAISTTNLTGQAKTKITVDGVEYFYVYTNLSTDYIAFTKDADDNAHWIYNTEACYPNKGSVEGSFSSSTPVFVPDDTVTWSNRNSTNYFNNGSWTSMPDVPTESDPYEIKDYLYPEGNWCNKDAVWIYDTGSGVTVTFRSELINEFNLSKYETAYKAGKNNSEEYSAGWNAFTDTDGNSQIGYKAAYEAAKAAIGSKTADQDAIDEALENLKINYNALEQNQSISVKLSHGMVNGTDEYYGTSAFVSGVENKDSDTGNINTVPITVLTATAQRNQPIVVQTTVKDSSYYVKGYIINGTSFKEASETTEDVFIATITLTESAVIVPVYFKDGVNEDNPNVVKLYAMNDDVDDWTDFMAAYVWYVGDNYNQFGDWTGQLLIPDFSSGKKMYYTFVEKTDPDGNKVAGITFNNYGNNYQINDGPNGENNRRQTYDYHEFLALQNYKNITFVLKKSDSSRTFLSGTNPGADAVQGHNTYELMTNIDGEPIDIYGEVLENVPTTQQADALYIIRDGHIEAGEGAGLGYIGTRTKNEDGTTTLTVAPNSYTGHYYVDCYVYDGTTGERKAYVRSYELEDLEVLAHENGRNIDLSAYRGKPVYVDYESRQGEYGGGDTGHYEINVYRYDGEWYAYNDEANFTVEVITALQGADGEYTFANADEETGLRNQADWGNVNVTANDETNGLVTVSQGTDFTITAGNSDGYNFVGWYHAEKDENGNITIGDEYTDVRTGSGKAIGSALFVAVYEEHEEGTLLIRNFAYVPEENVDKSKGQTLSQHVPKAQGKGDMTLSTRYVQVTILNPDGTTKEVRPSTINAEKPYQDTIRVETGQTLEITMYTKPNIPQDYVYAWYKQTFDDAEEKIVNYEEVAPIGAPFDEVNDAGQLKYFTFTYVVGTDIPDDITIYSDIVHQSSDITITYYYKNRYNQLVSYTKPYTLTGTEFANKKPSYETVNYYAPYVDDLYKKVTWKLKEDQTDMNKNGTDFYVYAKEDATFTVNLYVGNAPSKTYEKVPFNTAMDVYAKDINSACNKRGGVWFQDMGDENGIADAEYNPEKGDILLNYGNYLGLVVTDDMNIVYTDNAELVYQIILGDPVYGREQTTDPSGNNVVDKIYVDYIISYMIPHFSGDKIDAFGRKDDSSDDVTLMDDVNNNTPVQIKTLEAAGLKVDYGVVLEMVNVNGLTSDQFKKYYGVKTMSTETYNALDPIILDKKEGTDPKGNGVFEGETMATFFYVYESTNASNKNRVLKTFAFDNTPANQKKYYNVYGYLRIEDKAGNVETYYSNPQTLNIMDESIENTAN